jgi:hypothetical protein
MHEETHQVARTDIYTRHRSERVALWAKAILLERFEEQDPQSTGNVSPAALSIVLEEFAPHVDSKQWRGHSEDSSSHVQPAILQLHASCGGEYSLLVRHLFDDSQLAVPVKSNQDALRHKKNVAQKEEGTMGVNNEYGRPEVALGPFGSIATKNDKWKHPVR